MSRRRARYLVLPPRVRTVRMRLSPLLAICRNQHGYNVETTAWRECHPAHGWLTTELKLAVHPPFCELASALAALMERVTRDTCKNIHSHVRIARFMLRVIVLVTHPYWKKPSGSELHDVAIATRYKSAAPLLLSARTCQNRTGLGKIKTDATSRIVFDSVELSIIDSHSGSLCTSHY